METISRFLYRILSLTPSFKSSVPEGVGSIHSHRFGDGDVTVDAQIFYPASVVRDVNPQRRYARHEAVDGIANFSNVPGAALRGLAHAKHPNGSDRPEPSFSTALPLIIFSHGLGGNKEIYSHLCSDLAKLGHVVVALEHECGAGSVAFTASGERISYRRPPDDVAYTHRGVVAFRDPFLSRRMQEIRVVLDEVNRLSSSDDGDAEQRSTDVAQRVLRRVHPSKRIIAGHSFGGATVIRALSTFPDSTFEKAVLYDVWPYPIPSEELKRGSCVPTLSILSETFASQLPDGEVKFTETYSRSSSQFVNVFIRGTVHSTFSDTPYWFPRFIGKRFGLDGKLAGRRANDVATELVDGFLRNQDVFRLVGDMNAEFESDLLVLMPSSVEKEKESVVAKL